MGIRLVIGGPDCIFPMVKPVETAVTRLLSDYAEGDTAAAEQLMPLIYAELHTIAAALMRRERSDHTWQPTLLVHEAFLQMVGNQASWRSRKHFFAVAAHAMRRLLVNHAREVNAQKRGGGTRRVELHPELRAADRADSQSSDSVDIEALDVALARLAQLDERQARVVELRFFAGLDVPQTAEILGISTATVKRDWHFAKQWLQREILRARN